MNCFFNFEFQIPGHPAIGQFKSSTLTERSYTKSMSFRCPAQKYPCYTAPSPRGKKRKMHSKQAQVAATIKVINSLSHST